MTPPMGFSWKEEELSLEFLDELCHPKDERGIGVGTMENINDTCIMKRRWRFRTQPSLREAFLREMVFRKLSGMERLEAAYFG